MINNKTDGSGDRLRIIRKSVDKTQAEFAKIIQTSSGHISDMEKERKNISERTIKFICLEFNINEIWLRTGKGEMNFFVPVEDEYFKAAALLSKNNDTFAMNAIIQYWKLDNSSKEVIKKYIASINTDMQKEQD